MALEFARELPFHVFDHESALLMASAYESAYDEVMGNLVPLLVCALVVFALFAAASVINRSSLVAMFFRNVRQGSTHTSPAGSPRAALAAKASAAIRRRNEENEEDVDDADDVEEEDEEDDFGFDEETAALIAAAAAKKAAEEVEWRAFEQRIRERVRVANWVIANLFVLAFSYSILHMQEVVENPTRLCWPTFMFGVFCLSLGYLLSFFFASLWFPDFFLFQEDDEEAAKQQQQHQKQASGGKLLLSSLSDDDEEEEEEVSDGEEDAGAASSTYASGAAYASTAAWAVLFLLAVLGPFVFTAASVMLSQAGVRGGVSLVVVCGVVLVTSLNMTCLSDEQLDAAMRAGKAGGLGGPGGTGKILCRRGLGRRRRRRKPLEFDDCGFSASAPRVKTAIHARAATGRAEKRALSCFPPGFPNGWYKVCDSAEARPGVVRHANCLGLRVSVLRSHSGEVSLTTLRGRKDVISWPARDYYGNVMIFYHADGPQNPPPYELERIPELEPRQKTLNGDDEEEKKERNKETANVTAATPRFVYRGRAQRDVYMHLQDFAENAADSAHFAVLHRDFKMPVVSRFVSVRHETTWHHSSEVTESNKTDPRTGEWRGDPAKGPHVSFFHDRANLVAFDRWDIPHTSAEARVTFYGPGGVVLFRFVTPAGEILLWKLFTPLSPLHQSVEDVWFADPRIPRPLVSYVVNNFISAFSDDIFVWENKSYDRRPMLLAEDGPLAKLRRFYRRFYAAEKGGQPR